MQTLTVSLVQGATRWHDAAGNRDYYGKLVRGAAPSDLIVLPETFLSGFTNDTLGNAETMDFDADYILALEHGMPPAAGFGLGVDRLVMILTERDTLREVIPFPIVRDLK